MRLISVFLLLAGALGPPSAMATDRGDVMLRAFRDVCFPRLDLEAQKRKVTAAGFAQVPPGGSIPELGLVKIGSAPIRWWPVFEAYRGQRETRELIAILAVHVNPRTGDTYTACQVHDSGATESVDAKSIAEWLGRPADTGYAAKMKSRSAWVRDVSRLGAYQRAMIVGAAGGPLPDGYDEIVSSYEQPGAFSQGANNARMGGAPGAVLGAKTISRAAK